MGLHISAYCDLQPSDDEDSDDSIRVHCSFEHQFGGLVEGFYTGTECDIYFQRGYSGWSEVRELLATLSGWPEHKGNLPETLSEHSSRHCKMYPRQAYGRLSVDADDWDSLPLLPLIRFSDCEGAICTEVCKKISADLNKLQLPDELAELAAIFQWATDNDGVVIFG